MVRELLGDGVSELTVTTRTVTQRLLSPEHFASFFQTNYGPTLATLARLSDDGRRAFQKDLIALAGASNRATDGTLVSDWEFQIAVGTRA